MEDLGELHGDANKTTSISQQTTSNKRLLCASTELPMKLKVQSRGSQVLLTPRVLAPVPSHGFSCVLSCLPVQGTTAGEGKELSGGAPEHGSKPPRALAWVVAVSLLGLSIERIYGGGKKNLKKLPCRTLPNCSAPSLDRSRPGGTGP